MLQLAVQLVRDKKISSRDAEKQFNIPRRSLLNKINKCHEKPVGSPQRLTVEEEQKIVKVLIAAGDFGLKNFGVTTKTG